MDISKADKNFTINVSLLEELNAGTFKHILTFMPQHSVLTKNVKKAINNFII